MLVEIGKSEFMDTIAKYDSCDLSYDARAALYDWLEDMIDQGILSPEVCVGDWAIQTCEYTLEELQDEHPDKHLNNWESVQDGISYDFLGNCYSDVIVVDANTAVLVSL